MKTILFNTNISPFNLMFFLLIFVMVGIIVLFTLLFRNASKRTKKYVLLSISLFNLCLWIVYKYWLFLGNAELEAAGYVFDIYKELPLHLCNVSLFIVPIGILIDSKTLKSYGFYIATLGAIMALVVPDPVFENSSLFSTHNIGFYGTHCLIIVVGILLVTLGLFRPTYKIIPFNILLLLIMLGVAHGINRIFYACGIETDYFYTMHFTSISLLDIFWKFIPVRCIYLIFSLFILVPYVVLVTLPFHICDRRRKKALLYE